MWGSWRLPLSFCGGAGVVGAELVGWCAHSFLCPTQLQCWGCVVLLLGLWQGVLTWLNLSKHNLSLACCQGCSSRIQHLFQQDRETWHTTIWPLVRNWLKSKEKGLVDKRRITDKGLEILEIFLQMELVVATSLLVDCLKATDYNATARAKIVSQYVRSYWQYPWPVSVRQGKEA